MNSDAVLRFLLNQPFEPYVLFLVDGRTILVNHPEIATVGRFALSLRVVDESGRPELIDVGLIVSMKTVESSDTAFMEPEPTEPDEG